MKLEILKDKNMKQQLTQKQRKFLITAFRANNYSTMGWLRLQNVDCVKIPYELEKLGYGTSDPWSNFKINDSGLKVAAELIVQDVLKLQEKY